MTITSSGESSPAPARRPGASPQLIDRLRLRHLRLLDAIAGHGSLSAAAAQLNLSQPAATQMLRDLERAFGATLILRSAAGSVLAPAGEIALQRLRIALAAVQGAALSLNEAPPVPVVRLGMIPAIGVRALPRLVRHFAAQGPLPRLLVTEATVPILVEQLLRGDIDCMAGRLDLDGEHAQVIRDIVVRPLWADRLDVACAPDHPLYAQGRPVHLSDLAQARWIIAPHGARTRQFFEQRFLEAGLIPPTPEIESFSFHTNLPVAGATALLTMAPSSAVGHYARLGIVRVLPLAEPFAHSTAVFARRKEVELPVLEEIARVLAEVGGGEELGGA